MSCEAAHKPTDQRVGMPVLLRGLSMKGEWANYED